MAANESRFPLSGPVREGGVRTDYQALHTDVLIATSRCVAARALLPRPGVIHERKSPDANMISRRSVWALSIREAQASLVRSLDHAQ
jgi:hypothetical protein